MQIALGQTVYTSDGQRVGTIDRVLLNPTLHHVEQFVVHRGIFLDDDKVVARRAIERVDSGGVHLSIDAESAKALQRFEHSFNAGEMESGYPEVIPGPFQSMVLFPAPPAGMTYLDHGRLFQLGPLEGTPENPSSEELHSDIVIGKGAAVCASDGQRIGSVHEVSYDDEGALVSVVVQTGGLLRHNRMTIPSALIAGIGDEEITLNIRADELSGGEPTRTRS
jgi:sporulation protein YlmC with PRC-barrel domain